MQKEDLNGDYAEVLRRASVLRDLIAGDKCDWKQPLHTDMQ